MASTKERVATFLTSFENTITMQADGVSHKSPEHKKGAVDEPTLSIYSAVKRSDLSPQSQQDCDSYLQDGYVVLPDMFTPAQLEALKADSRTVLDQSAKGDNTFYGLKTVRSYALLKKTRSLDCFIAHPRVNTFIDALYAPNALLSALQLIEILPGETAQQLHYDQQVLNIHPPRAQHFIMNFIIAIDDFCPENGGTIVIPGSHLWPKERVPQESDKRVAITMKAGSCFAFSGTLWHGGGGNLTNASRRAVVAVYVAPWLRTLENQFLSVPLPVAASLDPIIQSRLGYSIHHPFVGSIDFQHPGKILKEYSAKL